MEKIRSAVGKFVNAVNYSGMAICFVMVFVVAFDVILRKVSGARLYITGSNEFSNFFLVFVTVLGIPVLEIKRGHVWVSMFVDKLPNRFRSFWHVFLSLVETFVVAMLFVGAILCAKTFGTSAATDVLNMPKWPFAAVVALGFAELLVVKIIDLIQYFIDGAKGEPEPDAGDGTAHMIVDDFADADGDARNA